MRAEPLHTGSPNPSILSEIQSEPCMMVVAPLAIAPLVAALLAGALDPQVIDGQVVSLPSHGVAFHAEWLRERCQTGTVRLRGDAPAQEEPARV